MLKQISIFGFCALLLPVFSVRGQVEQEMVPIEGGTFRMGREPNPHALFVDDPIHTVTVSSFYMDKYEVTNAMYLEFCEATGNRLPEFWGMDKYRSGPEYPDHPVVGVTWNDAIRYASWAGKRLPTEAEWEYAARGGLEGMDYPNGDVMDSTMGNYHGTNGHPLPVGSFPPNGFGLHDMSGNVTEWVSDYYDKDYYLESPRLDPGGPEAGKRHVIRGGGWRSGKMCAVTWFRQSLRSNWVDFNAGFRCVRDH